MTGHPTPDGGAAGLRLVELAATLVRSWRTLVLAPVIAGLVTAGLSLLLPVWFTATVAFVPDRQSLASVPAGLAGLASQFGVTLGDEPSESPRFYGAVARSRRVMTEILMTRFPAPGEGADSARLLDLLDVRGRTRADSVYRGLLALTARITILIDDQTGIARLSVRDRDPRLAAEVAGAFVHALNDFNATTRRSRARAKREFAEVRLAQATGELRQAEDSLQAFHERNYRWEQSPALTAQEARLERDVQIKQELYLTLQREHEEARLQEVNDTPVITVVDPAVPPEMKSRPRRRLLVIFAAVAAGLAAIGWAFVADYLRKLQAAGDPDYAAIRVEWQRVAGRMTAALPRPRHRDG
jgi:uncharacterized protein involved in exopolysaccharide biosynthesis